MAQGWQGQSRGGKTGYQIFIFLIRHLGIGCAYSLLAVVALYFIVAAPKSTADIWRYARKILKYPALKSVFFIYRNYFAFGQSLIDKVAISSGLTDRFHYVFDGMNNMEKVVGEHKGAIIMGAHFGNWAASEPFFRDCGAKLNLVMFDNEHTDIKEVLEKNKDTDASFKLIPVNKDNLSHIFMITDALDKGEFVCFLCDRFLRSENVINAEFMGYPVQFPYGTFHIATRMRVPVLFYFAVRERNRTYRFSFVKAEMPAQRKGAEEVILSQFITALEKELKGHPEQWYNYYDFWNLRNAGRKS